MSSQIHSAEYKKLICDQAASKEVLEWTNQYHRDTLKDPSKDYLNERSREWFSKGKKMCEASKVWSSIILTINVEDIDKPDKKRVERQYQGCDDDEIGTPHEIFMKSTPTNLIFCKYNDCRYGLTVNRETLTARDNNSSIDPVKTCRIEDIKIKNQI